jgi:hypothetical protein
MFRELFGTRRGPMEIFTFLFLVDQMGRKAANLAAIAAMYDVAEN